MLTISNNILSVVDAKVCILLTGTIAPSGIPDLKRTDVSQREKDYYYAISNWMKLGFPVVFVENSGYDSFLIKSLFTNNDNEFIQFDTTVSYLGKGHGEAEIVSIAFRESKILSVSSHIIKSSGRQYISNACTIMKSFKDKNLFVVSWLKRYLQYADSRFFIARKEFFINYLLNELTYINESKGVYFEHVLARAVHKSIADGHLWLPPNSYPICNGTSGTENIKYNTGFFNVVKGQIILKIMNRILKNDFL